MDDLKVIAEPRRREILRLVWDRELRAGEIAAHFDVSFPAISQHLGVLADARFVSVRRVGTQRLYRADRKRLGQLTKLLESMWSSKLGDLARLAEGADPEPRRGR
ncbi:MAG TPA: metalloregulator ArsR/SmtB family transcription factor [Candidatus Angelobacter sp.]|jgi:DNA-binding transcriptional ArsR family regulator|nr:metalloregulator ArsR/SmtB family transcription factor [Candidatus Angelobacter sp.]